MGDHAQQLQAFPQSTCVRVEFLGAKRGRGLVASESIGTAEVIYTEDSPLLVVQHEFSRLCGLTCSNCLCFVGSLKDAIRHILTNSGNLSSVARLNTLPDAFLEKHRLVLGPVVPCGEPGCEAVFCSEACRQHARRDTLHRMLCVDAKESRHWRAFLAHARRHHDGLVMAGLCVAQVLFEVRFKGRCLPEILQSFLQFHSAPWESLAPTIASTGEAPKDGRRHLHTDTAEGRVALLQESLALLKEALYPFVQPTPLENPPDILSTEKAKKDASFARLFELNFYSHLMGCFALVCLDVEYVHPLNRRLEAFYRNVLGTASSPLDSFWGLQPDAPQSSVSSEERLEKKAQEAAEADAVEVLKGLLRDVYVVTRWNEEETLDAFEAGVSQGSDALREDFRGAPLLPFIGAGLFAFGSLTNHSCWPNAEADFPLPKPSLEVRALRPIAEGEEVVISYIDESLSLHERQKILQTNYGFSCTCPRCVVEATEALLVLMKAPECADGAQLEDLLARRTGIPVGVVSEIRAWVPQEQVACRMSIHPRRYMHAGPAIQPGF
ncbi:uncharacterized protein LOC34623446 [Cyclospora cayetanensis]|uniref:Uncharacterized protein LOC34623446 n=1 Tax=Cyclospora cayetanensis TaxID=88456 RepID=A0A6P6S0H9_9EIME|nr:uncharacterized protein LOC34623446 [Cyclospora cayetanensis]